MRSRMDRYNNLNDYEETKRSRKNEELYKNIGNNAKYTNFTDVNSSNAIEIDNAKRNCHTREGYHQIKEYSNNIEPQVKKELDEFNYLYQDHENRVYDINSVLEHAKENRKDIDELEAKRKLKNTNYNILASLNPEELENYRREKKSGNKPDEHELRNLIDTITSKTLAGEISKETGVDLLSDLMATSALDKIEIDDNIDNSPKEKVTSDILDKESLKKVEEAKKELPKDDTNELMKGIDKSFYTKSMDLSDKDFLGNGNEEEEKKSPVIVKILLIIILIALVAVGAYFLYKSF